MTARIMAQAAAWFTELDRAQNFEERWAAFEEWLNLSPRHRQAFRDVEEASRKLDRLQTLRPAGGAVDPDCFRPEV
jgi:ferric-dicitrate binding protein FerR (iron transport regulator)